MFVLKTVEKVFGVSSTWCFILEKYARRLDPPENSLGGLPVVLPWGGPFFLAVAVECLCFLPWGAGGGVLSSPRQGGPEGKWQGQKQSSREQGRETQSQPRPPAMSLEIYRSKLSIAVPVWKYSNLWQVLGHITHHTKSGRESVDDRVERVLTSSLETQLQKKCPKRKKNLSLLRTIWFDISYSLKTFW